jgi:putative DNA primase/helicase
VSGADFHRLPADLRACAQWVVWRVEARNGKPTKVPYAVDGRPASTTDPSTWAAFHEVVSCLSRVDAAGIGFVFAAADPFVGVDLDGALDVDGRAAPWAAEIVAELDSYTEVSPSGRGLHVLVRGELRAAGNRRGPVEMYDRERYFTMTGRVFDGRVTICDRQGELEAAHTRLVARRLAVAVPPQVRPVDVEDRELLELAMRAKNGALFTRLWHGRTDGYSSRSEADLALVSLLVFWTGGDEGRVDRLFRASGLYREKWDRTAYRLATIERALASAHTLYAPTRVLRGRQQELGPGSAEELGRGAVEPLGPA